MYVRNEVIHCKCGQAVSIIVELFNIAILIHDAYLMSVPSFCVR